MAEVPYGQGVGQVSPGQAPNAYQNISATPESFGAGIGRGLEQLGAGIEKTKNFYERAAVDDQLVKDQERINRLLRGSGAQTGINPDGSPQYDLGYMGLKGRDALEGRTAVESQISDIIKQSKENLGTQTQVNAYDTAMRRYETSTRDSIGTHANTQATQWYQGVNKSTSDMALTSVTQNAYSDEDFLHAQADLEESYRHEVALQGGTSEQYKDASMRARRDALHARIEAISVNDPIRAAKMVEDNKNDLGAYYAPLSNQMKGKSDQKIGTNSAEAKWSETATKIPLGNPGNPMYDRVSNENGGGGFSSNGLFKLGGVESNSGAAKNREGSEYQGFAQMGSYEFKKFGPPGGDINNPQDNLIAANNYAKYNSSLMRASLNITPDDGDLYVAHQQGAGGAIKLFKNPNARAVDMVGESHILNNVPERLREQARNWTSKQFTDYWKSKFQNQGNVIPSIARSENQTEQQPEMSAVGVPTLGQNQVSGMPETSVPAAPSNQIVKTNDNLESRRQQAVKAVMDDYDKGNLTHEQQQYALNEIHNIYTNNKLMEDSNDKMKKVISDKAQMDFYDRIWDPAKSANLVADIRASKDIGQWEDKQRLIDLINKKGAGNKDITLGDGYMKALDDVSTGVIDSASDLIPLQLSGKLTTSGVSELRKSLKDMESNPEAKTLVGTKKETLKELENQIVYNGLGKSQKTELIAQNNVEGRNYYKTQLLPRFNAAYSAYMQTDEGKKYPYRFFDQKNIDSLTFDAPTKSKLGTSSLGNSLNPTNAQSVAQAGGEQIPTKPEGTTDFGWNQIFQIGRPKINGAPVNNEAWSKALKSLLANPTPERIQKFNKAIGSTDTDRASELIRLSKSTEDEENDIRFIYGD